MKKIASVGVAGLLVIAIAGVIVFGTIAAKEEPRKKTQASEKAAKSLQQKIDAIQNAEEDPKHKPGSTRVEVSDVELESYLLYSLKEDIPAQIDSADVQLAQDTVALDTQITFSSNATGNPVVDALVGGTHNLFVKGKLVAREHRGKFDLLEVRVDGIPVPNLLIQSLMKRYVQPKYPDVDLNEPFDMPWGIQELKLEQDKAIVIY
ncbi:MAG TPA: hypothetical protein VKK06_02800 [Terriglobia bacterium]|jgi:hypothetical protein|nr:hypothetical protein [Terriglobia bacterium]